MAEITRVYKETVPASRFIGIKYGDSDRQNGGFGSKWEDWFARRRFDTLEKLIDTDFAKAFEDSGAYIGLMRFREGEPFEYWIGMFLQEGAPVPAGFDFVDFPESALGVCWLYGEEGSLYGLEHICYQKLLEEGHKIVPDKDGAVWFFERYGCPRFTTPDDKGNVILDICYYVNTD